MPRYPIYPTQPNSGDMPSMWSNANRASDLTYSGSTAPAYQNRIDRSHGRRLAGLGEEVQDEEAQPGWALNELNLMAEMDDVSGNGVFDAPGTGPNIYPDSGVFAQSRSLPGYLARERMFAPSEVRDVTTGRPIIVVPNSPISFDTSEQIAFIERNMHPRNAIVNRTSAGPMPFTSTVNVVQNPEPIAGVFDALDTPWKKALAGGAVAAAIGIIWSMRKKRKGKG